ncbi:MAG TPA: EVE domain-containing protein [Longimicrobiales bacterium]|nr:EVE domain-containing protein [Longimicrobiales bacterium]
MAARHWLLKSEPGAYSIDDLEGDGSTPWTGVRNYQARNLMRDEMAEGDLALFYHSSTTPPGVVGIARIASAGYPDPTASDPDSLGYDEKHTEQDPRWFVVDVAFVAKLPRTVTLEEIKAEPALTGMVLTRRSRLSVQPVSAAEFATIRRMAKEAAAG